MASEWQGGPNFIKAKKWNNGVNNSGGGRKKYGAATMARRVRFNPNPTRCGHPGCMISLQSRIDKKKYEEFKKTN